MCIETFIYSNDKGYNNFQFSLHYAFVYMEIILYSFFFISISRLIFALKLLIFKDIYVLMKSHKETFPCINYYYSYSNFELINISNVLTTYLALW